MRRAVAFVLHAPGLRLVYSERLTPALARYNALAVIATFGIAYILYDTAPEGEAMTRALIAWCIGHFAWGGYLALNLPEQA